MHTGSRLHRVTVLADPGCACYDAGGQAIYSTGEFVTNPFENEEGVYVVLVNDENQHSLWPAFIEVPAGWTVVHDEDTRENCLEYVSSHWTDMRPASLIREMDAEPR
jgi:MbtH protein